MIDYASLNSWAVTSSTPAPSCPVTWSFGGPKGPPPAPEGPGTLDFILSMIGYFIAWAITIPLVIAGLVAGLTFLGLCLRFVLAIAL